MAHGGLSVLACTDSRAEKSSSIIVCKEVVGGNRFCVSKKHLSSLVCFIVQRIVVLLVVFLHACSI